MLADKRYDLVVLDELTYMLAYHYLDTEEVIASLQNRPVKHAFDNGIQAQPGIDW